MKFTRNCAGRYTGENGVRIKQNYVCGYWTIEVDGRRLLDEQVMPILFWTLKEAKEYANKNF